MNKQKNTYTTKLQNTYNVNELITDNLAYGDYKELIEEVEGLKIAPLHDYIDEGSIDDQEEITVYTVINPSNEQQTIDMYIPEAEIADYELEIQKQESSQYTDYYNTLADQLQECKNEKEEEEIKKEIKELEKKCVWNKREI